MSFLSVLLIIPIIGIFLISTIDSFFPAKVENSNIKYNKGGKETTSSFYLGEKSVSIYPEEDVFNADNKDSFFDVS